jgi:ribosomal protein S18 acetylase RimI-like enzyme
MVRLVDYENADPLGVLHLNLTSLDYALTPQRVALIRQLDPRPFPFFAVYAVVDQEVAGQVGVYRLPTITTEGPEHVGGVCALCTHPAFSRRGIATQLLGEAHARMRAAGLRFSTLGTARHRAAYAFYRGQGYEDLFTPAATLARRARVRCDSHLRAERAAAGGLPLTDELFQRAATGHLGFAHRHRSFIPMLVATGDLSADQVWLLWDDDEAVGYALATASESVLSVRNLLLMQGVDAACAVAALARDLDVAYLRVQVDQVSVAASLSQAGYPPTRPTWGVFMIKPLIPAVTAEDARRLWGVGTERFLFSSIDVT